MSLILKLVGTNINKEYIIKYKFNEYINIDMLINIFKNLKFTDDEINLIKFIKQGEQISNQNYLIPPNKEEYIFIFSTNENIRIKLKRVFEEKQLEHECNDKILDEMEVNVNKLVNDILGNNISDGLLNNNDYIIVDEDNNNDSKSITEDIGNNRESIIDQNEDIECITEEIVNNINKNEDIECITEEIINNINEKTLILLRDPDFRILIDIYKRRPELFQNLLHYTHSGDIVYNVTQVSSVGNYLTEFEIINKLNLNFPEDKIYEKLIKYGGHINLTLRSLLCEL